MWDRHLGPKAIFKDYKGYLQADAYSAYDGLYESGAIVEVGCLMHGRRKFHERGPATRPGRIRRWPGSACSTTSSPVSERARGGR